MSGLTREENASLYIKEHRIEALMSQLAESLIYKLLVIYYYILYNIYTVLYINCV